MGRKRLNKQTKRQPVVTRTVTDIINPSLVALISMALNLKKLYLKTKKLSYLYKDKCTYLYYDSIFLQKYVSVLCQWRAGLTASNYNGFLLQCSKSMFHCCIVWSKSPRLDSRHPHLDIWHYLQEYTKWYDNTGKRTQIKRSREHSITENVLDMHRLFFWNYHENIIHAKY